MTPRANYQETIAAEEAGDSIQDSGLRLARKLAIARLRRYEQPRANVLGVGIEALHMAAALKRIEDALAAGTKGYVCMAGVHGIMEAQRSQEVRCAFAESLMSLPDGMPTVWVGRLQGLRSMQRVAGPDLMLEVFRRKEFAAYTHFLYGGKPRIAEELSANLSRRFPWVRIVGTYTPPFHDLTRAEERDLVAAVQKLKPSIIWVGISSPRQEMFMRRYLPVLNTSLMFGVGAAFDFHTGRIRDSSEWIKRAGLQWFHRLLQDPRRLLWRYLRNNPEFICRIALQLAGYGRNGQGSAAADWCEDGQLIREPESDLCTGDYS